MIIESKEQLKFVLEKDLETYKMTGDKTKLVNLLMHNDVGGLYSYMRLLRYEEHWLNKTKIIGH